MVLPILTDEKLLEVFELIREDYPEHSIVKFDGLDVALLGLGISYCNGQPLLVYSREKIIEAYQSEGMTEDEAQEFFDYNIACMYTGPGTPMIVQ